MVTSTNFLIDIADYNTKGRKLQTAAANTRRQRMSTSFYHDEMAQQEITAQASGDSVIMLGSRDEDEEADEPLTISESVSGESSPWCHKWQI